MASHLYLYPKEIPIPADGSPRLHHQTWPRPQAGVETEPQQFSSLLRPSFPNHKICQSSLTLFQPALMTLDFFLFLLCFLLYCPSICLLPIAVLCILCSCGV